MKNVSTFYEINRLSVEASERGRGIGQLLLRTIEEFVKAKEQDHSDTKIGLFCIRQIKDRDCVPVVRTISQNYCSYPGILICSMKFGVCKKKACKICNSGAF
jgi:GNAT superfamily N-acetyltransferase